MQILRRYQFELRINTLQTNLFQDSHIHLYINKLLKIIPSVTSMTTLFNTTQTNSHSNEPSDSNSRGSSSLKSTENEKKRKIPLHKITNSANVMTGDRGVPDKYSKPDSTDMGDRKDPPVETKSAQGLSSFSKTASKAGKNMKANDAPPIRFQGQASKVGRNQKKECKKIKREKRYRKKKSCGTCRSCQDAQVRRRNA